jgi:predicted RNA-binding Zn-ribbon protein involved in translation (DUF1610 family)
MRVEKINGIWCVGLEVADKLLPCPHCGSKTYLQLEHTWTASYWIECEDCGAQMHDVGRIGDAKKSSAHLASARRVVKMWNTRA